jgi:transposase
MEASGHARWLERLLAELQFELWIGDAAEIRTKRVRKQKTDRRDAQLILKLLLEDRFPRIWVPSWENRDLRQLLWHRHRMVQTRTRLMNQLQAVASMKASAVRRNCGGNGDGSSWKAERFSCGKQVASYLGLVPLEESSGNRRRLGHITKQGSSMLRLLLVEAAQVTVRSDPQWRSRYFHLMMRRGRKTEKLAMARWLAVSLYWMWRKGWEYEQFKKFGSHAGEPVNRHGVE